MTNQKQGDRQPSIRIDARHELAGLLQNQVNRIASAEILVSVHDTGVHLAGSVGSWYDKQRAQETIRGLTSAFPVHNNVKVGPQDERNQGPTKNLHPVF